MPPDLHPDQHPPEPAASADPAAVPLALPADEPAPATTPGSAPGSTPGRRATASAAARRRAILCVLGSTVAYSVAAVMVKTLGGALPVAELVLFRNLFALPLLLPLALIRGGPGVLRMKQPWGHAQRVVWGLVGMWGVFAAYSMLPLATVTALGFTMPLMLTALSVPLLGERVGPRRWAAVAVGLLGVVLILRPGAGAGTSAGAGAGAGGNDPAAVALVLFASFGWAMAMISIRRMGARGESGDTIVLWFALGAALIALPFAWASWVTPSAAQWGLLLLVGLASACAQLLMTAAYRSGEPSLLAPFEYSAILWNTALGALIWSELPDGWDFAGVAVLVGSGLYIWHREVLLAGRRAGRD